MTRKARHLRISDSPRPSSSERSIVGGRFRLEGRIGVGGMGEVYAVTDLRSGRALALKTMRDGAHRPGRRWRFVREAAMLARVDDNHVVRFVESAHGAQPYIVMERLHGRDLGRWVRAAGPLPAAGAVAWLRQACRALAECHRRGVVHRDVKPSNLFITEVRPGETRVKLIDFGLAIEEGAHRTQCDDDGEAPVGSPSFMAPEQVCGPTVADPRTDVWGLGATLYYALTGSAPFRARSAAGTLALVLFHDPPAPAPELGVPAEVEELLFRCLAKTASERYPSVAALSEALDDCQRRIATTTSAPRTGRRVAAPAGLDATMTMTRDGAWGRAS